MAGETILECKCGAAALGVEGDPFLVVECLCKSCRTAGRQIEALPGAPPLLVEYNATGCAAFRKDRVRCARGNGRFEGIRLTPESSTRRVIATCCNTAMFMEFTNGHWLDIYTARWPDERRPAAEMRTMTADLPDGTRLPDDIPNYRRQSVRFYARLFDAWAAMRFRRPKIDFVNERTREHAR